MNTADARSRVVAIRWQARFDRAFASVCERLLEKREQSQADMNNDDFHIEATIFMPTIKQKES